MIQDPEVIIIGGGPAGSALGCYLSMAGVHNLIVESAHHPRPHVGESMVTSSTRVFEEIGFLPVLEREGCVRKYGATWHAPTGRTVSIEFGEFPQEGIEQDYTYHVDRARFDLLLLEHAEALGSEVVQGTPVMQVNFDGDQACGVRASVDGQERDIGARIVVDASGRRGLLGRQLGRFKPDPLFNQFAAHAWFEKVDRGDQGNADFIHIYFLPVERGWAWQIPINESVTSMGVVTERNHFIRSGEDLERWFSRHVSSHEDLSRAMHSAVRITDLKQEADYSYSMNDFVGNGFLMVGDAARFVDPIFSSGVSVALYSAKFAAEVIPTALESKSPRAAAFAPYQQRLEKGVAVWYEFICLYYKLLPSFTYFIQSPQYRLEILRLLQGEVFDRGEVEVLDRMRDFIQAAQNSETHAFRSSLTDLPIPPRS